MMQSRCSSNVAWKKTLIATLMLVPLLSACGRQGHSANTDVSVSIHAVNYSDEEFEYFLADPLNASNRGGGEPISRYAAGGTMCCYSLPKTWQPGMKIKLDYELYFPNPAGGNIRTTQNAAVIEIPQYVKPEELWLVRDAQGGMSIVISDFQPDHPQWPGKVKGWPVPTLAYHRERADIYIKNSREDVKAFQELSDNMKNAPLDTAKEMWEFSTQYDKESIVGYTGYEDKRYQAYLVNHFRKLLVDEKETLKNLEAARP